MADRYLILMRSLIDGEWEVVPDGPGTGRCTPFKQLANAKHLLGVLQDRDPRHERVIVAVSDPEAPPLHRAERFHR